MHRPFFVAGRHVSATHPQGGDKLRDVVKEPCKCVGTFLVSLFVGCNDAWVQAGLDHAAFLS